MKTTDLRTAAQQALEALYEETAWFGPTPKGAAAIAALKAALAQQDEPVKPAPLKRNITGRCTRKVCECEKEGLGPECIYLEPVDVGLLEYRGNSVAFIHQKMTAYRTGIDAAWDAFKAKGLHPDGKTSLADMIAKYTDPPRCPNCASLEAQNTELDRKLAELEQAEPSQEPVAWLIDYEDGEREVRFVAGTRGITQTPLYAAAPTAKPVAWMTDRKEMYFDKDDALRYSDSIIQPLYLAPPQRKPLTEEKIDAEWRELDGEVSTMFMRVLRKFARAIERAHGIGETK